MAKYDFKATEQEILTFWKEKSIYQKAKDANRGKESFYFLDGPPYTSGKVHIGTAWNKSLKDCILRYKRMKGFDVWDRAGYDMHGLPTENATQKKLNLTSIEDIKQFGIPKFIEECKQLCIDNMHVMNEDFKRMGVWMDFDNAYQSIKKEFMESEWWLIKKAHEKGRLYEGLRTMTWCQVSESALAKHELEYKEVTDESIFVKLKRKGTDNEHFIIWTTTPWTIPLNLAIMVNPELDYVKAKVDNEYWWVAEALVGVFISSVVGKKFTVVEKKKGSEMEGWEYHQPFEEELKHHFEPIKKKSPKAMTILLSGEFVDTSAGSGLVHCAPGCGPEDYEVGHRNGIAPFNPINRKGIFPKSMGPFAGLTARKDDKSFTEIIEKRGLVLAKTMVTHDYPHDERHHHPVIFRTTKQWFFKIEDLKGKMIAANNDIKWVPRAAFNAFDSWLKNLRDNSISKQRFWGTPLPIWRNISDPKDYMVVGSASELEKLSGQTVADLHLSHIDHIEIKKEGKTYRRIPDILDVWVDAGTVSWNGLNYPKENNTFDKLFPADFILEGKDQIRGWFNLLMVASFIAFDKPSFKNCYMHGFVQDAKGRKMSKSLGNYILPEEVISQYGADTLRYYAIAGANAGVDLNYNFEDMKVRFRNLGVFWNVHNYLLDICKNYGINPRDITKVKAFGREEQFIFSKLNSTIKKVTDKYDSYQLHEVPDCIEHMYLELSRTYIQLIRDKVALGSKEDKELVVFTIYRVMIETLKMLATVTPFIAEKMYQNLKQAFQLEKESVHLYDWPRSMDSLIDEKVEKEFEVGLNVVQSILAAREKMQRGVRWPIKEAIVVSLNAEIRDHVKNAERIIMNQTNVKTVKVQSKLEEAKTSIIPNAKALEEEFSELTPKIIAKLTTESTQKILEQIETKNMYEMTIDERNIQLKKDHLSVHRSSPENVQENEFRNGQIYLNKEMDQNLEAEGYSRELMRRVQKLRKEAGLEKKDTINLQIEAERELADMFKKWESHIKDKVGADVISYGGATFEKKSDEKVKGKEFSIALQKIG